MERDKYSSITDDSNFDYHPMNTVASLQPAMVSEKNQGSMFSRSTYHNGGASAHTSFQRKNTANSSIEDTSTGMEAGQSPELYNTNIPTYPLSVPSSTQ